MALRVEAIEFGYRPDRPVLRGVTAVFPAGAVTVVVGPNGSGKSTLLRLLLGALSPGAGRALLGDAETRRLSAHDRGRRLALAPQRSTVWAAFSVREVVAMGRHARRRDDRAVAAALDAMDLADRGDEPFGRLSVGQQQRATLARVLAQVADDDTGPRAVLADEPVAAMDPRHALLAMAALRAQAKRGLAVVVVLHDLTLAARWADRALVLSAEGRTDGPDAPVAERLTPERLEPVFGTPFDLARTPGGVVLAPRATTGSA